MIYNAVLKLKKKYLYNKHFLRVKYDIFLFHLFYLYYKMHKRPTDRPTDRLREAAIFFLVARPLGLTPPPPILRAQWPNCMGIFLYLHKK